MTPSPDDPPPPARDRPAFARQVATAFGDTLMIVGVDRIIQILLTALVARLVTPGQFGVSTAALMVVNGLALVAFLGIGGLMIQTPKLTDRMLAVAQVTVFLSSVIATAAAWAMAPLAALWFKRPDLIDAIRVLSISCVIQALFLAPNVILMRSLKARTLSLIDLASGASGTLLVTAPAALMGMGYWALILGALAQSVVKLALLWRVARPKKVLGFSFLEAKALVRGGSGYLTTNALHKVASEGDQLIVGRYLSAYDLGLYHRANGLMSFPSRFYGTLLDRVAFPAFAQVQSDADRLRTSYLHAISLTALLGWPLAVVLFLSGADAIMFVLGPAWMGAAWPLKVLCAATYFKLSDRVNATLLRGSGRPYLMAISQSLFAVLMLGGCIWASRFGLVGIAAAVMAAAVVCDVMLTLFAARISKVSFASFARAQGPGLALAVLLALILTPIVYFARQGDWSAFTTLAALGLASGFTTLAACRWAPRVFLGRAGRTLAELGLARAPRVLRQLILPTGGQTG